MYQRNPLSSGAKWFFFLAIVVFVAFLMLGADIFKATWMNGDIAAAQAEQISSQTMMDQKNAELDYVQRKFYADLEMQKALFGVS
jgi:hypothetical protein